MVRFYCPRCNTSIAVDNHNTDFVHACAQANNTVLSNEDILNNTNTSEEFGGTVNNLVGDSKNAGVAKKNWGQRSWVEGGNVYNYTVRGARANTHRTRTFFNYIDLKEVKKR